ncbi:GNAT family N-acetyltransferase [Agrobacterium rosae]
MDVRFADQSDRDRVIALLRESHAERGYEYPFQAAYAEKLFQQHLAHSSACVLLLGKPAEGVLMAVAIEHPFGMGRVSSESLWYVSQSSRGRGGFKMLDAYEDWARGQRCTFAGIVSLKDNDVSKLYERRGYSAVETHFMKPL